MGFSFVRAAVACAILERTSNSEKSSEITVPRYLKVCYGTQLLPFYLDLPLDANDTVCHQFGLLPTNFHLILYLVQVLLRLSTRASSSCSSSTIASMLSANSGHLYFCRPANLSITFFKTIRHNPFEKNVE